MILCEYKLSQSISDYLWVHVVTVLNQHYHSNQNVCINFRKGLLFTSPRRGIEPDFPRDRDIHRYTTEEPTYHIG